MQVQALASQGSRASLHDLTKEQLATLSVSLNDLGKLSPLEQFHALTPEQFEMIPEGNRYWLPSLIRKLYEHRVGRQPSDLRWPQDEVKDLGAEPLGGSMVEVLMRAPTFGEAHEARLRHVDVEFLTEIEMRELFLSVAFFTPEQIKAIALRFIPYLWSLPVLSVEQIQAFDRNQMSAFSAEQLNLLSAPQVQALTAEHKMSINLNQKEVQQLNAAFMQALFPEMTPERVRGMGADEIAAWTGAERGFSNLRIKAILVHCSILNRDQLNAIQPEQMRLLGRADLASMDVDKISAFLPEQISDIHVDAIIALTPQHISHFTQEQARALTDVQIKRLCFFSVNKQALLQLPQGHLSAEQLQLLQ
jgi:hypothetical protein